MTEPGAKIKQKDARPAQSGAADHRVLDPARPLDDGLAMSISSGFVAAGFEPVREAFERNFEDDLELGASFAAYVGDELVVDLTGGFTDRKKEARWDARTLCPVFSTTKPIAALVIAMLVDRGQVDYDAPLSRYWPEFAAEGKGEVTVAEALSHQAGVPGFPDPIDPDLKTAADNAPFGTRIDRSATREQRTPVHLPQRMLLRQQGDQPAIGGLQLDVFAPGGQLDGPGDLDRHARILQQCVCQCRRAARSSASPIRPSARQATTCAVPGGMTRPQPGQVYSLVAELAPCGCTFQDPSRLTSRRFVPSSARSRSSGSGSVATRRRGRFERGMPQA